MDEIESEQPKKRKETEAQRKKQLTADISAVLSSQSGRNVLSAILGLCQVEGINGLDGNASGRIEGARTVGILTIRMLREADFAGFEQLNREIHNGG